MPEETIQLYFPIEAPITYEGVYFGSGIERQIVSSEQEEKRHTYIWVQPRKTELPSYSSGRIQHLFQTR